MTVVFIAITMALQGIENIGSMASLLISGPLMGGFAIFFLTISRGGEAKFEQLFDGFKAYSTYLVAYLLMAVFVLLWALLLIVPGIVAALSYSMTYFILADNPTISASAALKRSKELMIGNKGKYFFLMLRFFGWMILAVLSCGIGLLWLLPYIHVSTAKFYDDIKGVDLEPATDTIS